MALMPDISVLTMMKIYGKINAYKHIRKYRNNEALKKAIPNFNPSVKFGIHYGESIEGCIGSQWKIDSAYISLHVIVAKQLAAATYTYGVKVLISGEVVDRMSEGFREHLKIIDVVNVEGTDKPLELYTMSIEEEGVLEEVDIYAHLDPEQDDKLKEEKVERHQAKKREFQLDIQMDDESKLNCTVPFCNFKTDPDIYLLRKNADRRKQKQFN